MVSDDNMLLKYEYIFTTTQLPADFAAQDIP